MKTDEQIAIKGSLAKISELLSKTESYIASFGNYDHYPLYYFLNSGFRHLYGFSTSPDVFDLRGYHKIKFSTCSFTETHLPSHMFDLIFLHVVDFFTPENSGNRNRILEFLRLLKNTSYLVLICDKNLSCLSYEEIIHLFTGLKPYGVEPFIGKESMRSSRLDSYDILIFKVTSSFKPMEIGKIHLIVPTLGLNEGQSEYGQALVRRFQSAGIDVVAKKTPPAVLGSRDIILLEYEPHLSLDIEPTKGMVIDLHYSPKDPNFFNKYRGSYFLLKQNREGLNAGNMSRHKLFLMYSGMLLRNPAGTFNYFFSGIRKWFSHAVSGKRKKEHVHDAPHEFEYRIVPHIDWKYERESSDTVAPTHSEGKFKIGTFGFAVPTKRVELICKLALRLEVPALILLSISEADEEQKTITEEYANSIKKKYQSDLIQIETGFFEPCEIVGKLSTCSHLIFAQAPIGQTSGSMRLACLTGLPVISVDSPQARDSQVFRVKSLREIDRKYLETHKESINIDDGFQYLLNFLLFDYVG